MLASDFFDFPTSFNVWDVLTDAVIPAAAILIAGAVARNQSKSANELQLRALKQDIAIRNEDRERADRDRLETGINAATDSLTLLTRALFERDGRERASLQAQAQNNLVRISNSFGRQHEVVSRWVFRELAIVGQGLNYDLELSLEERADRMKWRGAQIVSSLTDWFNGVLSEQYFEDDVQASFTETEPPTA